MTTTVRSGGEVVSTETVGGRTFTTRTPAPTFSVAKKRYSSYIAQKKEAGEKEASKFVTTTTTTKTKLRAGSYDTSRQASRKYRKSLLSGGVGSASPASQKFITHVYPTSTGKPPSVFARVENPTAFTQKYLREQEEIQKIREKSPRPIPQQYRGTSSTKYGYVSQEGKQIATPEDIARQKQQQKGTSSAIFRTDPPTRLPTRYESLSMGIIPRNAYGTTSKDYGRVSQEGVITHKVTPIYRNPYPSFVITTTDMMLPTPTFSHLKKGYETAITYFQLPKDKTYFQIQRTFSDANRASEQRIKKYRQELDVFKEVDKPGLPVRLGIHGREFLINFERSQQRLAGFQSAGQEYVHDRPAEIGLMVGAGAVFGSGVLGAKAGTFLAKPIVSKIVLGAYVGSTGYRVSKAPTAWEQGEILGKETVRFGALAAGYAIGSALKPHPTGLKYAPKKQIQYAPKKPLKYAPKKQIQYAPKIKGEIKTPADRTTIIRSSRFAPVRFAPSPRETGTRISLRVKPRIDYYAQSLKQYQVVDEQPIKQASKWAKPSRVEASYYRPRYFEASGLTGSRVSQREIKLSYKPSDWAQDWGVYITKTDSRWALAYQPPTKTIIYRPTKPIYYVKPTATTKVDTRTLGAQPINYKGTGQKAILRINPQKEYYTGTMYGSEYKSKYPAYKDTAQSQLTILNKPFMEARTDFPPRMLHKQVTETEIMAGLISMIGGKSKTQTLVLLDTSPKSKTKQKLILDTSIISIPKTKIELIPDLAKKTTPKTKKPIKQTIFQIPTIYDPTIPPSTPVVTPVTPVVVDPIIPPPTPTPLFDLNRRGFRTKYGKVKGFVKPSFKGGYYPSLEAAAFNIIGKKPPKMEYQTGLTLRPLLN